MPDRLRGLGAALDAIHILRIIGTSPNSAIASGSRSFFRRSMFISA